VWAWVLQGLSNMVWGLGKLGARPTPAWLYALVKTAGECLAPTSGPRRELYSSKILCLAVKLLFGQSRVDTLCLVS
jgi:hypothetical protein